MISYQELVAALTTWRARQGLPTAQSDYLGEPVAVAPPPLPESAAGAAGYASFGRDDGLGDDLIEEVAADDIAEEIVEQPAESGELFSDDTTDMVDLATEQQGALAPAPSSYGGYDGQGDFYQQLDGGPDYQSASGAIGYPEPGYPPDGEASGYSTADDPLPAPPDYDALDGPPDPFAEAAALDAPPADLADDGSSDSTLDVDEDLIMAEDDPVPAGPPPLEPPPGDDPSDPNKGW